MGRKGEAVKSGKHALLSDELIADKVKGLDIGLSNSAAATATPRILLRAVATLRGQRTIKR